MLRENQYCAKPGWYGDDHDADGVRQFDETVVQITEQGRQGY